MYDSGENWVTPARAAARKTIVSRQKSQVSFLFIYFFFERQFPAMNLLILLFVCFERQFPAMDILILLFPF